MIATLIALIIILLCMAYCYLKCDAITSFATVMAALLGLIVAFAYYESAANFVLSKGHGGQWALPLIYILLFVIVFAVVRTAIDFILGAPMELDNLTTKITAGICGLVLGMIVSGMVLVTMSLAPLGPKWPYKRFGDGQVTIASLNSPKKALINADGFAAGLFSLISKGSLSSKKSFAVYHSDYLDQIHLSGLKSKDSVYTVAGKKSFSVPSRGVRRLDSDNENLTVVRIKPNNSSVERGGMRDPDSGSSFTLSQVRLICKEQQAKSDTLGSAVAVYPRGRVVARNLADKDAEKKDLTGLMNGRVLLEQNLDDIIVLTGDDFKTDGPKLDIAFDVPSNMEPILLEFKHNAVTKVPSSVIASEENEEFLRTGGQPDSEETQPGNSPESPDTTG